MWFLQGEKAADLRCAAIVGSWTYLMLWPEDGKMRKEDVRRVYDGSIFYDIAAKREKRQ